MEWLLPQWFLDFSWEEFWDDVIDVLLFIPRKTYELLLDAAAWLIQSIPAPSFVSSIPSLLGSIPDGVSYFLWLTNLAAGLGIIIVAYVLRFLIRRLPIVG